MQGTSRHKIYQELGLKLLKSRRWYKRLYYMFKIMKKKALNYFINLIPKYKAAIRARNNKFLTYNFRMDCLKYFFFPYTLNNWFRLDINIRNSKLKSQFHCSKVGYYLSFVRIRVTYAISLTQFA